MTLAFLLAILITKNVKKSVTPDYIYLMEGITAIRIMKFLSKRMDQEIF